MRIEKTVKTHADKKSNFVKRKWFIILIVLISTGAAGFYLLLKKYDALILCKKVGISLEEYFFLAQDEILQICGQNVGFHGVVLDQNNTPVADAKIEYSLMDFENFLRTASLKNTKKNFTKTDSNGRFHISGTGGSLTCFASHPDYYLTQESSHSRGHSFREKKLSHNDSENPFIFRLHKKGICEPLYYSCSYVIGKGEAWIPIPKDGLTINLANGKVGESETNIYIFRQNDRKPGKHAGYSWGYTLRIPGGGFVKNPDRFSFIAPENGYVEEISFSAEGKNHAWEFEQKHHYFLKFPNGLYGIFEIQATASGRIIFQALINPNPASRNLEYEYEKQINKNSRGDKYHSRL